ncbi:hypothetical protein TorRG33x02_330350 [Trema orientale]|uniref:Uncharacterized protein n=1 Tax=Trema orientale TaxID=63057 RepID=A0A2P5B797_TREOI|nr:hypothetical protein TorRG33x02_330350 [Trema orientale]
MFLLQYKLVLKSKLLKACMISRLVMLCMGSWTIRVQEKDDQNASISKIFLTENLSLLESSDAPEQPIRDRSISPTLLQIQPNHRSQDWAFRKIDSLLR